MFFASFKTEEALSHVQRALDELARAGFALKGLYVSVDEPTTLSSVRIDYAGSATISANTYLRRLEQMHGIMALHGGAVQDPSHAEPLLCEAAE